MTTDASARPEVSAEALQRQDVARRFRERSNGSGSRARSAIMLALAVTKQQLSDALREKETLLANNKRLARALTDASIRGTEAQRMAHHDALTGLPNRLALTKHLYKAIATAGQQQHQLALLFIDLDGFKVVNDGYGHTTGDKLLVAAATRIVTCIRADDFACRYGGDEFVVLLPNVHDTVAAGIAETIRSHISQRYAIDGTEFLITASIGLAQYPSDGERSDALLSHADASMYRSKSTRYQFTGGARKDSSELT